MIVSTHDLNLAAALCDASCCSSDGRGARAGRRRAETLTADNIRAALRRRRGRAVSSASRPPDGGAHCPDVLSVRRPARRSTRCADAWRASARCVAHAVLAPLVGSTPISLARVFDRSIPFADNVDAQIFFVARLPRVLAAALVGSALALSGVVFQALLRNPLASPDTLGVSAGAALGAMLAITFNARFLAARHLGGAAGQLRRVDRRARDRLRPLGGQTPRHLDARAAARRRDAAPRCCRRSSPSCSTWPTSPRRSATCAG